MDGQCGGVPARKPLTAEQFCWSSFVASTVHPVKVAIIEALLWIEEPISGAQFGRLFRGAGQGFYESNIRFHLRALVEMGLLEAVPVQASGNSSKEKGFYFAGSTTR
jgi:hypothetical protein